MRRVAAVVSLLTSAAFVDSLPAAGSQVPIWVPEPETAMPVALSALNAAVGPNGEPYVGGGANDNPPAVFRLYPETRQWEVLPNPDPPAIGPAMAVDYRGRLYIISGAVEEGGDVVGTARVLRFDPSIGEWEDVASLPEPRHLAKAVADRARRFIYLLGGLEGDEPFAGSSRSVLRYDVDRDTWTAVAPMLFERSYFGAALGSDDMIYAVGGSNYGQGPNGPTSRTVERYDPSTDTWTQAASLGPEHNEQIGAVVADDCGFIYAIGGWNGKYLDVVERYSIADDTWIVVDPITTPRNNSAAAFSRDGSIWIFGGDSGFAEIASVERAYVCPPTPELRIERSSSNELRVILETPCPVTGVTVAVRLDPTIARFLRLSRGADLAENTPHFENRNVLDDAGSPMAGGILLGWTGQASGDVVSLPAGTHELFRLEVFKTAGSPESACAAVTFAPRFRSGLDSPVLSPSATDAHGATLAARTRSGEVCLAPVFTRGDANADGELDLSDGIFTLLHLFRGDGVPGCRDAADVNDDGALDIADPVHWINHLFLAGIAPLAPYAPASEHPGDRCGVDPTDDELDCLATTPGCVAGD